MIVCCGGLKGGTGKSTVATNLAVLRALGGRDTLLVDADDQQSSAMFTAARNEHLEAGAGYCCVRLAGRAVRTEVDRLKGKHQDIVIDSGGRDTSSQRAAISVADVLLLPIAPRSLDLWTVDQFMALVEEMRPANPRLRCLAFLNRADSRGDDNERAAEMLRAVAGLEFLAAVRLGVRKAYANAAALGLSVVELRPADQKASGEIVGLERAVFGTKLTPEERGNGDHKKASRGRRRAD